MATSGRDAEGKPLLDDGSFAGMLSRYGFRFEEKDQWDNSFGYNPQSINNAHYRTLVGRIFTYNILSLHAFGSDGVTWSSSADKELYVAFYAQAHTSHIYPNVGNDRIYGASLRCQK